MRVLSMLACTLESRPPTQPTNPTPPPHTHTMQVLRAFMLLACTLVFGLGLRESLGEVTANWVSECTGGGSGWAGGDALQFRAELFIMRSRKTLSMRTKAVPTPLRDAHPPNHQPPTPTH